MNFSGDLPIVGRESIGDPSDRREDVELRDLGNSFCGVSQQGPDFGFRRAVTDGECRVVAFQVLEPRLESGALDRGASHKISDHRPSSLPSKTCCEPGHNPSPHHETLGVGKSEKFADFG
ncbi:unnamed protein product [Mycena citricolor]|uniref:Uncharacterized protein n=1 Tax=Mycena citricolor TaxID=2018698 RepID=A0AAD2GXQ0_9AGAR|nr:unnamed protein product [Mycena citricolor]